MINQRSIRPLMFVLSSLFVTAQQPEFEKNLEAAWQQSVGERFSGPLRKETPPGSWAVTASIEPDYWGEPVYFRIEGSYRTKGGSFLYREVVLKLSYQAALLKTAHPDWSSEEIERHLIFADLESRSTDKLPDEGEALIKALRETQGPILPFTPGVIFLHPTMYSVKSTSGPIGDMEYTTAGWRGTPNELEQALRRGEREEPLVVLLNRWRSKFLTRWKEDLRQENYASLLERLDLPALGTALFDWACGEGEKALVEALIRKGVPLATPGPDGNFPLISACRLGDRMLIQRILDAGGSVNASGPQGCTPLSVVCGTGDAALVEWLISKGAQVVFPEDLQLENPITSAVRMPNLKLVQSVFRAAGPIPDRIKQAENVDLIASAKEPHVVKWLLAQGCKATNAALEYASRDGSVEVMQILLEAGADPNSLSPLGNPLIYAVNGDHLDAVQLLLRYGADPKKVVPHLMPGTALEAAKQCKNPAILKALKEASSKP